MRALAVVNERFRRSITPRTTRVSVSLTWQRSGAACFQRPVQIFNHLKRSISQMAEKSASEEPRRTLYPPIEPYDSGFLKVSDIHTLYYEQCGNPTGKPAVVLHGGPEYVNTSSDLIDGLFAAIPLFPSVTCDSRGGGCDAWYRQFFDPSVYRIVLFDQRGAGKSTPHACLEDNTTWHLVDDIEKIRQHLGIDKWVVFGGSWGSTLSLAYAETHPDRVKALVLRGIFMLRRKELIWFYQEGAHFLFPDQWDKYLEPIPEAERGDLMFAYHRRLTGNNEDEKVKCARAWSCWEMATSRLYVDPAYIARAAEDDHFAVAFARIECHYFVNAGFFKTDGQLLQNAGILKNIPGVIVQGRYDIVCPMLSAWDLHKAWPQSELHVIADAGHSAKEPGIISELVKATDKFRDL